MITFGYDNFKDGTPTVNIIDEDCLNRSHYNEFSRYFNIEAKQINEIDCKYYYVIDVILSSSWINKNFYSFIINDIVKNDIINKKSKILILYNYEAIVEPYIKNVNYFLRNLITNNNLPKNSIILSSGNYSYTLKNEFKQYVKYIPYSLWEHLYGKFLDSDINLLKTKIKNKTKREKIFLNYNRRNKYHRMQLVQNFYNLDIMKFGLVSLGNLNDYNPDDYNPEFIKGIPYKFDNTDLDVNQAFGININDFLDSYISVVTESHFNQNELFITEKICKPFFGLHPFIHVGAPYFLKYLKSIGYKTFSKWWDESYDEELNVDKRIIMITKQVKELTEMSHKCLHQMLKEMLPILEDNYNNIINRINTNQFQLQLEKEFNNV